MWYNTKGASPSNSTHVPTSQQRDFIQTLHPTKVYHFGDGNVCFVKNLEDDILKRLLRIPTIFCHHVFNIQKTIMKMLEARVATYPSARGRCETRWCVLHQRKTREVATNVYSRKMSKKPKRRWSMYFENEGSGVVYARGRY